MAVKHTLNTIAPLTNQATETSRGTAELPTQAEALTTNHTKMMTPLRTKAAIDKYVFGGDGDGSSIPAGGIGDSTSASADKLTTPRAINGTNFDGTANITTAHWGTTRNITIGSSTKSVNGSANVSFSLAEIGAMSASAKPATATRADTADKLTTARTIALSGDVTGSTSFDGSANVTITTTVANDSHTHAWGNITGKPSTFAPSSHTHAFTQITGVATSAQLPVATTAAYGTVKKATDAEVEAGTGDGYVSSRQLAAISSSSSKVEIYSYTLDADNPSITLTQPYTNFSRLMILAEDYTTSRAIFTSFIDIETIKYCISEGKPVGFGSLDDGYWVGDFVSANSIDRVDSANIRIRKIYGLQ